MFPNDAKNVIYYTSNAPKICPILLPATTTPRTILQAQIISDAGIGKILIGGNIYAINTLTDRNIAVDVPKVFTNQDITCEWVKDKSYEFTIVYLDYDLTKQATNLLIEHPTEQNQDFLIQKTYTFGDITTIFTLGLIAFFVIFYVLKRIFTHDEVSIHSYQTKF